jgi:hypothetical protein
MLMLTGRLSGLAGWCGQNLSGNKMQSSAPLSEVLQKACRSNLRNVRGFLLSSSVLSRGLALEQVIDAILFPANLGFLL